MTNTSGARAGYPRSPLRSLRVSPRPHRLRDGRLTFAPRLRPAQIVVAAFAAVILAGTFLLMLPIASQDEPADFLLALFIATSATCVTGLSPVDTAIQWTGFGQTVILALIQIGGLGIMTFTSLVGIALTRRVGLQARLISSAESRTIDFDDARRVLVSILRIVAICEGAIAVLLYFAFVVVHGRDPLRSIWDAVFHAISAFNNAGFSTFEGNLVDYVGSWWVCLPIAAGIIAGGLGFPVIVQLRKYGAFGWRRLSMTAKIVLTMTPILLAVGTITMLVFEWGNAATLGELDPGSKFLAAFFQSVQTRTAGFNTVDIGALDGATLLIFSVLQFIGAGPAGTAGGIKVTTFLVMAAMLWAIIRGDDEVRLFHKRVPWLLVRRASGIGLIAFALCGLTTLILMATTPFTIEQIVVEVTSAWGTVGLSTGITGQLPPVALVALIALMFIGRLGPLTIAASMINPTRPLPYEFPEERPIIA